MELAITFEIGVNQRPFFLTAGGVVCLHAHIDAHEEILEVKSDAGTIGRSNLLIEFIELEHASRLVLIVFDRPDIARIQEKS